MEATKLALEGEVDQYDLDLFGEQKQTREDVDTRLYEVLDGVIDADRRTAKQVNLLAEGLTKSIEAGYEHTKSKLDSSFKKLNELVQNVANSNSNGPGHYLYIDGEKEAFGALIAAISRAKLSIKTTRFSPYAVAGRQNGFASIIRNRVLGEGGYDPVPNFFRLIAVNGYEFQVCSIGSLA